MNGCVRVSISYYLSVITIYNHSPCLTTLQHNTHTRSPDIVQRRLKHYDVWLVLDVSLEQPGIHVDVSARLGKDVRLARNIMLSHCVRACLLACVRAWVHAWVRACVHACFCARCPCNTDVYIIYTDCMLGDQQYVPLIWTVTRSRVEYVSDLLWLRLN